MDFTGMTNAEIDAWIREANSVLRQRNMVENLKSRQFGIALEAAKAGLGKTAVKNTMNTLVEEAYAVYAAQQASEAAQGPLEP